jgi:hypothetical protein
MPIFAIFAAAAPEMLAIEAAAVTAAEIAAAEAAAVAAAEAAAATAAQQAAATTAAEAAATTAAQQAATTAAQQGAQAGIMEIGGTAANTPLTSEAVNAAAQQANAGIQTIPDAISPAQRAYMDASSAGFNSGITPGTQPLPAYNNAFPNYGNISDATMRAGTNPSIPSNVTDQMLSSGYTPAPPAAPPPAPSYLQTPTVAPGSGPMTPFEYRLNAPLDTTQSVRAGTSTSGINMPNTQISSVSQTPMAQPPSALESGMNTAIKFAKENPFTAMTGAYGAANMLGLMKPSGETFGGESYDGPLSKYRLSNDFQAGSASPEDFQYTPRRYAMGGIMNAAPVQAMSDQNNSLGYQQAMTATGGQVSNFAKGGSLSESIDSYQKMLSGKPQAAPARSADVGIYYDQDPDTRYQDPLTAAQIRQAKVNQRAYVSPIAAKRPTPMGQLQMASVKPKKRGEDVEAAQGGIMHSSLGGYAAGGNPRLLKGPGDGMSDNIPATINGRQPARLADGEFVIPADVVSHLGNGSTEAGAKQLHAMMNKVRKARTGNSKQGKNIRPQKYMPK